MGTIPLSWSFDRVSSGSWVSAHSPQASDWAGSPLARR